MKIRTLAMLAGLVVYSLVATGCATIMKGDKSNVYLMNAPADIKVYENEQLIPMKRMDAHELYSLSDSFNDEANSTRTSYSAWGVTLNCTKPHTLKLVTSSKSGTVQLEPTMAMKWFWVNLLFAGVPGWVTDGVTDNWNELAPVGGEKNLIDVSKYLR